jgi:hypothetical protein
VAAYLRIASFCRGMPSRSSALCPAELNSNLAKCTFHKRSPTILSESEFLKPKQSETVLRLWAFDPAVGHLALIRGEVIYQNKKIPVDAESGRRFARPYTARLREGRRRLVFDRGSSF